MRRAWLAGSLPGSTPTEAIDLVLRSRIGRHLLFLPSGEVDQPIWAASIARRLAKTDQFRTIKHGDYRDYRDMTVLSPNDDLEDLDLGYYDRYLADRPVADELLHKHHLAKTFQVGIVSPFDQSMITVGPGRHLRCHKAFINATLRDVMKIYLDCETVVFQLEGVYELCGALKAPAFARSLVIRRMVRHLTHFVSLCPPGIRIGIHPCLGDLSHEAMGRLPTLAPLVEWVNELCDTWPAGYTLAYVQLPLCEGRRPPVINPGWYTDLKHLHVPDRTRVIMGLCHEQVGTDELRPILALADSLLHRTVDVGASCGLALRGSRTLADVRYILDQQADLCEQ